MVAHLLFLSFLAALRILLVAIKVLILAAFVTYCLTCYTIISDVQCLALIQLITRVKRKFIIFSSNLNYMMLKGF